MKLSNSIGEEQEIKTSEEIDGILKQSNRILTGKVSFNFPNFGIFCVPIMNETLPYSSLSKFPVFSISDSVEPVSEQRSNQWKILRIKMRMHQCVSNMGMH